ncbi:MAG TPA: STAS/SEC14 domain-containing protein [Polyangiales bacterium]|nr:STAS/SEC14 domain-containing protein [Polyangiales bacterium]
MLDVMQVEGPVVAFRAEGTLTADDYDRMTNAIDQQLREHENVGLFADVSGLRGLSLGALIRDFRYSLSKLGELHRLNRVAVVSEKAWLRAWTQLAWMIVPRSNVRTFQTAQRDAALAWTSALEDQPPQHALTWIHTSKPDVYAFEWNGTFTQEDIDDVLTKLEVAMETHMSVRLLARVKHISGIRADALLSGTLARVKLLGIRKVERYAFVTSSVWLARYVETIGRWVNIDMRHFPLEREQEAWDWLEAKPIESGSSPIEA